MTDDDKILMGEFLDTFLAHPLFANVVDEYNKATISEFLDTIPPNHSEREEIYFMYNGFKQFLDFLHGKVAEKERILDKRSIEHDEETSIVLDERIEDDYGSVHPFGDTE